MGEDRNQEMKDQEIRDQAPAQTKETKIKEAQPKETKPKKSFGEFMQDIAKKLTRKSVGGLIGQIAIVLVVIPEAFLLICGLIFDKWLKLYDAVNVIFVVWIILMLIGIYLTVMSIIWYSRSRKK